MIIGLLAFGAAVFAGPAGLIAGLAVGAAEGCF